MTAKKQERKPITKKTRFEVFKRDSFKCQYCGAKAPEVVLHVDHIKPVSKGGNNDLLNLVTSCISCNLGKSDKTLDDNAVVSKTREQMEELQDRREQLEMMMEWKEGLRDLNQDILDRLCDFWHKLAPGYIVNDNGQQNIKKWLRKFSLDEIMSAMDIAAESYLKFNDNGSVTSESWEEAFAKIPGICRVEQDSKENPDLKDIYYIRGIARNRCGYFDNHKALDWLKAARSWDIEIDELKQIACDCRNWSDFLGKISEAIEYQKKIQSTE
ncbi:HNH endonuclease [Candidatus Electronema sp. JM]|uniref:HNH endonuclease n=1 Tax=Candidatus Electronema sp. JM TaxID=3401571 RepID=UPI003AA859B0